MEGILSDQAISDAINAHEIEIDPYNPAQLNITSYDLTLGKEVRVYERWVTGTPDEWGDKSPYAQESYLSGNHLSGDAPLLLDASIEPKTVAWDMPDAGFLLKPGIGYLMHTRERIWSDKYNPILDGKSSIARLFIQVHATAGYGDAGFDGQFTLEVIAQHPVRIYPGMRIAQIRFHTIVGTPSKLYSQVGHYTREASKGAIASQAWKQFT